MQQQRSPSDISYAPAYPDQRSRFPTFSTDQHVLDPTLELRQLNVPVNLIQDPIWMNAYVEARGTFDPQTSMAVATYAVQNQQNPGAAQAPVAQTNPVARVLQGVFGGQ